MKLALRLVQAPASGRHAGRGAAAAGWRCASGQRQWPRLSAASRAVGGRRSRLRDAVRSGLGGGGRSRIRRRRLQRSTASRQAICLPALAPEHRALILLKFGRSVDAQPYVDQALKIAGGRATPPAAGPRRRLSRGWGQGARRRDRPRPGHGARPRGRARAAGQAAAAFAIDNGRRAYSEVLIVLAAELNRLRNEKRAGRPRRRSPATPRRTTAPPWSCSA